MVAAWLLRLPGKRGGIQGTILPSGSWPHDLGTPGGMNSSAYGINNLGQVVGTSTTAYGFYYAALWTLALKPAAAQQ